MIDFTINIGNILTFIGFLIASVMMVVGLRSKIDMLADSLVKLERDVDKMTDVIVQIARQDERMSAMDRRMNDLGNRVFKQESGSSLPPNGMFGGQ